MIIITLVARQLSKTIKFKQIFMNPISSKIAIIGAGAAGLSAAWFLQQKGYRHIKIFEKSDRVGGKCFSPSYRGKTAEMGAAFIAPSYKATQSILDAVKLAPSLKLPARFLDAESGTDVPSIAKEKSPEFFAQLMRMKQLLSQNYKDHSKPGHATVPSALKESFADFLQQHNVPLCAKIWLPSYTSFGYSYFNEISASYVFKYLNWPTLNAFFENQPMGLLQGTQMIWKRLADKLISPPLLCASVRKVVRTDQEIVITTDTGRQSFDKIIVTTPLPDLPAFMDTQAEEEELFTKIIYQDYKSFACTVKNYPKQSAFISGNMIPERTGHTMFYYARPDSASEQLLIAYVYGDQKQDIDTETCCRYIKEDFNLYGLELDEIVLHKSWRYFPHVTVEDFKAGWYEKMENRQGVRNIFYAGEVMNFSSIEGVVSYSKALVDRFF